MTISDWVVTALGFIGIMAVMLGIEMDLADLKSRLNKIEKAAAILEQRIERPE